MASLPSYTQLTGVERWRYTDPRQGPYSMVRSAGFPGVRASRGFIVGSGLGPVPLQPGRDLLEPCHLRRVELGRHRVVDAHLGAGLVAHYARRTERLDGWFTYVSFALGGEAGARLAGRLGMKASSSTLLRRLHGAALASLPPPEVIGVDDFALPKGISCGVVRGFGTFMTGLKREQSAVAAALLLTYGNGQTEGQVSCLKTLKGQMYGRASFGLLRRRFLGVV